MSSWPWPPPSLGSYARGGSLEKVKDLLEAGADPNTVGFYDRDPALHIACSEGHVPIAKVLIDSGANVNAFSRGEAAPLHFSCAKGHIEIVNLLLDSGADINGKGDSGISPIMVAISCGNEKLVGVLMSRGAAVDCVNGYFLLHMACRIGSIGIARLLIKSGIEVNEKNKDGKTPLAIAIRKGHKHLAEVLIDEGANLNEKSEGEGFEKFVGNFTIERSFNKWNVDSLTPLSIAVCTRNNEMARMLIARGARLNDTGENVTPLHRACYAGYTETATLLLESGAKVNEVGGHDNETPLHFACKVTASIRMVETVKILIQYGADLESKTTYGLTPYLVAEKNHEPYGTDLFGVYWTELLDVLIDAGAMLNGGEYASRRLHNACEKGDTFLVKKLLKAGVNANTSRDFYSSDESNLLHRIGIPNQWEIMKLLIESGADVNNRDYAGRTPLHEQCSAGRADTVELLLQSGARIEQSRVGKTPLHVVDGLEKEKIVNLLLSKGTSVDAKDSDGRTALHLHCMEGNSEVVVLLLAAGANIQEADSKLKTPLHYACNLNRERDRNGDTDEQSRAEIFKMLLSSGASVNAIDNSNMTPVDVLSGYPHSGLIEVLLQFGGFHAESNRLNQALHNAIEKLYCYEKTFTGLKALLKYGADTDGADESGMRPIHKAGMQRSIEAVKILLDHGCDVDGADGEGKTILHHACANGWPDLLTLLLEHGANPNKPDQNGMSPLHHARQSVHRGAEMVKALLNKGALVNFQDSLGNTALHYVSCEEREYYYDSDDSEYYEASYDYYDQCEVLKLLIDAGADVNLKNNLGEVPFIIHITDEEIGYDLETPRLFLEAGANIQKLTIDEEFLDLLSNERLDLLLDYGMGDLMCECRLCPKNTPIIVCAVLKKKRGSYVHWAFARHAIKVDVAELDVFWADMAVAELDEPQLQACAVLRAGDTTFRRECENEVGLMKAEVIGDSCFTYYDLLRCQDPSDLRKHGLPWSLTSAACRQKFPIYGDMIYSRFAPMRKKLLVDRCSRFFELADLPRLPPECVLLVLEKLCYNDLLTIAEVCFLK